MKNLRPAYLDDIRLKKEYEKVDIQGMKFWNVTTIPSDKRWLQAAVETTQNT